jgi:hypothetical protein
MEETLTWTQMRERYPSTARKLDRSEIVTESPQAAAVGEKKPKPFAELVRAAQKYNAQREVVAEPAAETETDRLDQLLRDAG